MEQVQEGNSNERAAVRAFLTLPASTLAFRLTERLDARDSPQRDAAVAIVEAVALLPSFARQDLQGPGARLCGEYAARTIDRGRDLLARNGIIEAVPGSRSQGGGTRYRVCLEALIL